MSSNYHNDVRLKNTIRLRERLALLPAFVKEFFRGIEDSTASRTRLGYAYDLHIFFDFLVKNVTTFMGRDITKLTIEDLALVCVDDIEDYMEYLSYYVRVKELGDTLVEQELENEALGKARKLSSLRTMFTYFFKRRKLESNPADLVESPKITEKAIVRLEPDEVARLLDETESGEGLTKNQLYYHEYTKTRDVALLTLLLGTGMRVSECVGINIGHVDFDISGVKVTRKGGNEAILYFGEEVSKALSAYMDERERIKPLEGHEEALFLSIQKKRLTDRAMQNLVKKYSRLITTLKNISPHKLRSTFGTSLYRETGDIYLVASVLGHSDVNTTKKHYAALEDDRRRAAAKMVKLRED